MTDRQFEDVRQWAAKVDKDWWKCDRQTAIVIVKPDAQTIQRLHDLKMAFLYTDYGMGKWITQRHYSNDVLAAIAFYLYWEITRASYKARLNVFLYSTGVNTKHHPITPDQQKQMLLNEDSAKLNEVFKLMKTTELINAKKIAVPEIKAITDELSAAVKSRH